MLPIQAVTCVCACVDRCPKIHFCQRAGSHSITRFQIIYCFRIMQCETSALITRFGAQIVSRFEDSAKEKRGENINRFYHRPPPLCSCQSQTPRRHTYEIGFIFGRECCDIFGTKSALRQFWLHELSVIAELEPKILCVDMSCPSLAHSAHSIRSENVKDLFRTPWIEHGLKYNTRISFIHLSAVHSQIQHIYSNI